MNPFDKIKALFFKQDELDSDHDYTVDDQDQAPKNFLLSLDGAPVGYLRRGNGQWQFEYSDEHKLAVNEGQATTVLGFPKIDERYTSPVLWPFFQIRLPGNYIYAELERENIDASRITEAEMLEQYGKHSILNPFKLSVE